MNCTQHVDLAATALCHTCGRGLCNECADAYEPPTCAGCVSGAATQQKSDAIKFIAVTGILFLIGIRMGYGLPHSPGLSPFGTSLFFGYVFASIPSGWRALTKVTPRVFLILPLFGWVLYFVYKLAGSFVVGPFVMPFRLSSSLCLLAGIEGSRAKLWAALGGVGILILAVLAGEMKSNKAPVPTSATVNTPAPMLPSNAEAQKSVVRKVTGAVTEIDHPRAGLTLTVQGADGIVYMFQPEEGKVVGISPERIRVGDELNVEFYDLTQNYPPTYGNALRTIFVTHNQPGSAPVATPAAAPPPETAERVPAAEPVPAPVPVADPGPNGKSTEGISPPARLASGRVVVPESVMHPLLIQGDPPVYPPMARQVRISGTVVLTADISATGTVENVRVMSGQPMLTSAASDAVRRWRYKPYTENGQPVPVRTQISVPFVLNSDGSQR